MDMTWILFGYPEHKCIIEFGHGRDIWIFFGYGKHLIEMLYGEVQA